MAVTSSNGVTILKPTAWKWYAGGAVMFFLLPGFGMLIGLVFILMGARRIAECHAVKGRPESSQLVLDQILCLA